MEQNAQRWKRRRGLCLGLGLLLMRGSLGLAQGVEYADVNHDGEVNFLDIVEVRRCVGQNPQARPPTMCHFADTNRDDRIDATDLAIVTRQLGRRDYSFGTPLDPATLVDDPRGDRYPINRVVLSVQEHVTRAEVETLAAAMGGRIVRFSPRPPLYTL